VGGHGATPWVPSEAYSTVAGIPLPDLVKMGGPRRPRIDEIVDREQQCGAEIVNLLQPGSAFYPRAASAIAMARERPQGTKKRVAGTCRGLFNGELA